MGHEREYTKKLAFKKAFLTRQSMRFGLENYLFGF